MELFKLLGIIAISNKEANNEIDETTRKGEQAESKLDKAFTGIGKAATVTGKVIASGLAVGATAMAALTTKALNFSGELEQNMGGSEAVFSEYADKMQKKAESAFEKMGLSTSNYLATANKMGALFKGAGFEIEQASDLAANSMQRAADVASIMGIDVSVAMESVAGAAKGNFTMMDNLGVAINDTTLQAYALEKGITKSTQAMTTQEKVALAMEMFMERTAYAAGNYAKENDTLAGSLNTAKAALTNFLDGSGDVEQLVSAVTNAGEVIVGNLIQIAPRLASGVSQVITSLIPLLPPMVLELLPAIIEGAINLTTGLISALPMAVELIIQAFPGIAPLLISGLIDLVILIVENLPVILEALLLAVPEIAVVLITSFGEKMMSLIGPVILKFAGAVEQGFNDIKEKALGKFDDIKSGITEKIENVKSFVQEAVEKLKGFFNFEWKLPKIKLPHFSISGSFSLNPPSIPHFSVEWYKKAYDNAMLLNSPTIFGFNSETGNFMGGGDKPKSSGPEVVAGANTLMSMIETAATAGNEAIITVLYLILDAIVSLDENMGGNMREALEGLGWEIDKREFMRLVKGVI